MRSPESRTSSKLASYQADPFSTAGMGVPGPPGDRMLPTAIETLARAVWVGLPQAATPVFVTTVPSARLAFRVARNLSTRTASGASVPRAAPELAVIVEPAKLTPVADPFRVADWFTYVSWPGCVAL